jgi:membrane protein required for colicin V production
MAVVDWVILAVLIFSVVQAARRGFFVEAFSLAGIVVGIGVASWNYTRLAPWFARWVHTAALADAAAFLTLALAVMVGAGIAGRLIRWSMRTIGLGWADRLLGAVFGLVKGAILVTLGILVLVAFWPQSSALRGSRLGPYFVTAAKTSAFASPAQWREKVQVGAKLLHEHLPDAILR